MSLLRRYFDWLHLRWPAGGVEKLPEIRAHGKTVIPGVRVVGDLTGVPLLKFAADSGAQAAAAIADELNVANDDPPEPPFDLAIVGAGVAGISAALEAQIRGLRFVVFEASAAFSTIANFPKAKPIYTYPTDMKPSGELSLSAEVKEDLLAELERQRCEAGIEFKRVRIDHLKRRDDVIELHHAGGAPFVARRVIVAIGRSGNHRKLGVPGEDRDKVFNRLHDPADFAGRQVMVVGGGDSALEATVALANAGAAVTLSYRGAVFSRAKPENVASLERSGARVVFRSQVVRIEEKTVSLKTPEGEEQVANDAVFTLIGREAPLDFFRRSGIPIQGETSVAGWLGVAALLLFCTFVYTWKSGGPTESWINPAGFATALQEQFEDRTTVLGTVAVSLQSRSFYYTLLYSSLILGFGIARIRRRRTPYVRRQTIALMVVQWLPLFILPEVVLPWAGYNGAFSGGGAGEAVGDALFEKYIPADHYAVELWPENGHPRAYWRAYGFILAWPLNVYNVFTQSPHWWWLGIGFVQTFVLIPWMVIRWGKGAYCGWICSCGALAETMGDRHRHKMPHGPGWNVVNLVGQVFLAVAVALLAVRVVGWVLPGTWIDRGFNVMLEGKLDGETTVGWFFSYKWFIDVLFAGIIGVSFYFKYSGRVWCRFACPLAALMHIYTRFSRFRIFADKKKCISCNVCTSVCHQGIDVMSFANRGLPMEDPQCVRCSACVQSCPTAVLSFGRLLADGRPLFDELEASPVRMRESARHRG